MGVCDRPSGADEGPDRSRRGFLLGRACASSMELSYKGVDQSLTGLTAFLFLVLLFHDGLRGHFLFNP